MTDPLAQDCDCVDLLEQRAAQKGHQLTAMERFAAMQFTLRMNRLETLVTEVHRKVGKMEQTLYDTESGILVRQKITLDRVAWTKWVFVAIGALITFVLGSIATVLLIRDRL